MKITTAYEYATEGAPLLVGDLKSAALWRGTEPDAKGVTLEYMGLGVENLPKELLQAQKPGRQVKKFKSLEQAVEFERALLTALREMHPQAARHPSYPNHPAYYVGDKRVFSIERKFSSPFDALLKALKKPVELISVDKKKKADALFVQQQGGGRGLLAIDHSASTFALVKFHASAVPIDDVRGALEGYKAPQAEGSLEVDGRMLVFDSAYSAQQISELNWRQPSLQDAASEAFKAAADGPLRIRDQKLPCVAFVRLTPGKYEYAYQDDADLGRAHASVLSLTRA